MVEVVCGVPLDKNGKPSHEDLFTVIYERTRHWVRTQNVTSQKDVWGTWFGFAQVMLETLELKRISEELNAHEL